MSWGKSCFWSSHRVTTIHSHDGVRVRRCDKWTKMTYFVNVVINVSFISLDKLTSVEEGPPA